MKFNKKWLKKRWVAYTIAACSAVLFYVILTHLHVIGQVIAGIFGFVWPVLLGIIIAYVIDPLIRFLQRMIFGRLKCSRKTARTLSVITAVGIILFFVVLLFIAIIPQIISSVMALVGNLDSYAGSFRKWLSGLNASYSNDKIDVSGLTDIGETIMDKITAILPKVMDKVINTSFSIGTKFLNVLIGLILAVYFLLDKERLMHAGDRAMRYLFKKKNYEKTVEFLGRCNEILIRYIVFDLLDGLIVGAANFVFMKIAHMPYAMLISVVVGVTNLAPTFGPIVGGVIGGFILLLVNPSYVLGFVIFTLIIQTVDGYILKPRLFSGGFGVSALWILISIIVGGRMFGMIGIILAIPFAAIIDFIFREYFLVWIRKRSEEKKLKEEQEGL